MGKPQKPGVKTPMTNDELLKELPILPDPNRRAAALGDLDALRAFAPQCMDSPAFMKAMEERERKLRLAGEALKALPAPFLEFYQGIGLHLIAEADKVLRQIKKHQENQPENARRPVGLGKVRFIDLCNQFMDHYFPVPFELKPGQTLLTSGPDRPRDESIALAKGLWDSEGLDSTKEKAWKSLVKKNWNRYLKAKWTGEFFGEFNYR